MVNSLIANLTGLDGIAVGTMPIQARAAGPSEGQDAPAAGFAGLLSMLLGNVPQAAAETTADGLVLLIGQSAAAGSGTPIWDRAPADAGFPLPEGITEVYALATTGRAQSGPDVGGEAPAAPQAAGTEFTVPTAVAGKIAATRSDILAGLLPLADQVAAGTDTVSVRTTPPQPLPQIQASPPGEGLFSLQVPPDPRPMVEGYDRIIIEPGPAGRTAEPGERPAVAGTTGSSLSPEEASSAVRTVSVRVSAVQTAVAVDSAGRTAAVGAKGNTSPVAETVRESDAGARAPRPIAESQSDPGQTSSGSDRDGSAPSPESPGTRRATVASRFDRFDSALNVASPGGPKVEGNVVAGSRPETEQVISAVLERVESAKTAGRREARFEILTEDGQAINVKISVHRNLVSARIGVSSAETRDALAGRIWELGQRLESGGLTPESIEVVLVGGWSEGSHQSGKRKPPRQKAGDVGQDSAAATLVEAERHEFERWA